MRSVDFWPLSESGNLKSQKDAIGYHTSRSLYKTCIDIICLKLEKENVTWNVLFVTWNSLGDWVHSRMDAHMGKRESDYSCPSWFLTWPNQACESKGKNVGTLQNNEVPTRKRDHKIPCFVGRYGVWQGLLPTAAIFARNAFSIQKTLAEVKNAGFWQH